MKAARIARDLDSFVGLVAACSNLTASLGEAAATHAADDAPADGAPDSAPALQASGGMIDRGSLEEVLHDVRSSADGFNRAMFGRVVQVAASSGPSVLPVDAFSVWHIQVTVCVCGRVQARADVGCLPAGLLR